MAIPGDEKTLKQIYDETIEEDGDFEALQGVIKFQLKRSPEDISLIRRMGGALFYQGEQADAAPWLLKAVLANPDDARLVMEAGEALYSAKRYQEAIPYLEKTVGQSPRCVHQQMMLGYSFFKAGNPEKAAQYLRSALKEVEITEYHEEIVDLALAGLKPAP